MYTTASNFSADNITPAVHLEFIQNQLENTSASATDEIEKYHRALFLHHHAIELEKYRQRARTHEDRLSFLDAQLKATKLRLSERSKLVPVTLDGREDVTPRAPWNGWDIAMFVAAALGILGLITFGILNISFNLVEFVIWVTMENNDSQAQTTVKTRHYCNNATFLQWRVVAEFQRPTQSPVSA